MKTGLKFLALLLLLANTSAFAERQKGNIRVVSTRYQNLFVFKVDKYFSYADVEISYSNGDVVAHQSLQKRKMVINFCDVKSGNYTIKVRKGDQLEEFQYVKK